MLSAESELESLLEKSSTDIARLLTSLGLAWAEGDLSTPAQMQVLTAVMHKSQAFAEMLGRKRLAIETANQTARRSFGPQFAEKLVAPTFTVRTAFHLPLAEALAEMEKPNPTLREHNATARVLDSYPQTKLIPQVNNAANQTISKVRQIIDQELQGRLESRQALARIRRSLAPWAKQYANTIYRNALSDAYNLGRFKQLKEMPSVQALYPAFQYHAIEDANVRPQHLAWNGIILGVHDTLWGFMRPPIYHNCRCVLVLVAKTVLEQLKRLDEFGAVIRPAVLPPIPIPNFGYRPA